MAQPYGYQPMPGPPPQPAWQRPARPRTVSAACLLLVLITLFGFVSTIVTLSSRDTLRRAVERGNESLTQSEIDNAVHFGLIVGIVVGFGVGIFYLFLAYKMWRGRNWARITTWVFMGLAALGVLIAFVVPASTFSRASSLFSGLCAVAIIVLLARRPSNDFFRKPPPAYGYYPPPAYGYYPPPQTR